VGGSEGWKDGRVADDAAERQPKVRPVLVLEAQRSMGPALVHPLRFGALFSLSPTNPSLIGFETCPIAPTTRSWKARAFSLRLPFLCGESLRAPAQHLACLHRSQIWKR